MCHNARESVLVFQYDLLFFNMISAVPNRFKYRQRSHNIPFSFSSFFLCSSKSFQIPSERPFSVLVFKVFTAIPNHFKCRQNAPFTVPACFQNYLCNYKLFQIPSESTIYCHCFQNFQEATLVLMPPSCIGTTYVLFFLLKFQISFKKVSKGKL